MKNLENIPQMLYSTSTGNFWLPVENYNDPVIHYIKNNYMFEQYIVDTCKRYIEPGSTVIDVGANFGQMSLQWSKFVGETGHVHSFECSDFVSYFLKKTIEQNEFAKNIKIHTPESGVRTPDSAIGSKLTSPSHQLPWLRRENEDSPRGAAVTAMARLL